MKTWLRLLCALVVALVPLAWASPAYADDNVPRSWRVTDYAVTATPDRDGTVHVSLDLGFDFASDAGHGPFIVLPKRARVAGDPDHWRELPVTLGRVSSSTGADTTVKRESKNGNLVVRLGRDNKKYTGVQRYTIDYTVRGVITPDNPVSGLDEVNWNAVGPGWQVPITDARVTIQGPAGPAKVACFTGKQFTQPCEAAIDGDRATFAASELGTGIGVQTVVGYPAGTFSPAAAPTFTKRYHLGNMFPVTPVSGGLAGAVALVGLVLVALRVRRHGSDEVYAGLTPGLTPAGAGAEGRTVRGGRQNVAVQFTPPKGATPSELGTLIDERADNRDVTAAIVDLAVRGHLRIEQLGDKDFALHQESSRDPLLPYEKVILGALFDPTRDVVTRDELKGAEFAEMVKQTREALYDRVTQRLGWFAKNPEKVRVVTVGVGILIVLAGAVLGLALGATVGLGLVGVGVALVGLALIVASRWMPSRTAKGSAVLAQTRGFEKYLATAEADQIRFEEGVDVFSRYLPYAIAFGVADHWAKVFAELAASGRYQPDTSWYASPNGTGLMYGMAFSNSLGAMTSSMESAVSSSVQAASSSGSSGFSGGGGFGGGGGGGW